MSGSVIQEKVAKLLSRQNGKPVLRPIKPLALKNDVASRKLKKGEATCVTEMSLLMACWKKNDFNNTVCSKEVSVFYACVEKGQNKAKGKQETQGRLLPKEANTLLKRFPNLSSEI
ncbi:coiled-coil-helix-coiled-coil-helix domain-containing protein 1-like isoform X2 [Sinocyclocheilus grahami]|uniref:coiled-coil-helix-coiled-coil-helix domain-containing protein 1-like isoform X1 n=1 Tax=Sinocyclocheilus grahami TaxID=75366 RepID=UPI0007ACEDDC|nr:PREDICTED: coiled-coil-helix-coiled-coil-helix domain-containing protein 1-like isoform X1 [Sinocyclocheilus grahami]XP_016093560.1 PREDICTED: coiled-coil-helix-coiled-coil-helix domain-containing protein 1-like isoform X2 [Sinocyclocheilus grahami]